MHSNLSPSNFARRLAIAHGAIYVVSGLWPVVNIRSFMWATGPKIDQWLVKTVGLLLASSGFVMLNSIANNQRKEEQRSAKASVSDELAQIALSQCLILGSVSLFYSLRKRISKIYLLDSLMEYSLALGWVLTLKNRTTNQAGKKKRAIPVIEKK